MSSMQSLLPVVKRKPDDVNIRWFNAYINNHTPSVRHNSAAPPHVHPARYNSHVTLNLQNKLLCTSHQWE